LGRVLRLKYVAELDINYPKVVPELEQQKKAKTEPKARGAASLGSNFKGKKTKKTCVGAPGGAGARGAPSWTS